MGSVNIWLRENWFPLLQTVGIIGGLLFTAISIRQATKARKATDLLTFAQQHRDLWKPSYTKKKFKRIFDPAVDLVAAPVDLREERFLNEAIIHFQTGWELASKGSVVGLEAFKADARSFFNLPIPKSVWKQSKDTREKKFVKFIDDCLASES